jgi:hypothetical protein
LFSGKASVRIDREALYRKLGAKTRDAQAWLDKRVMQDCDPFVPMDVGTLAGTPRQATQMGSGRIIYNMPYARRLYYGESFNFSKDRHPKATHHWFEEAKRKCLAFWLAGVAKIIGGKGSRT